MTVTLVFQTDNQFIVGAIVGDELSPKRIHEFLIGFESKASRNIIGETHKVKIEWTFEAAGPSLLVDVRGADGISRRYAARLIEAEE